MKKIPLLLLVLLAAWPLFSQTESTLLWEISGKNLGKPSYIFGTIHLICPDDFFLSDSVESKLAACSQLYLELDFDDPAMLTAMQQKMLNPNGPTMQQLLSESDYKAVNTYLTERLGMGLETMAAFKPFGIMSTVLMALMECQPASYEMTLSQLAGAQKTEVLGLETVAEQMQAIDSIPAALQAEVVARLVREETEAKAEFAEMVRWYKSGDLKSMASGFDQSRFGFKGYEDLLLTDRNRRWITRMETIMQDKPTFFAVGAAHLGGENGVLNLLRKSGYTVTAVP